MPGGWGGTPLRHGAWAPGKGMAGRAHTRTHGEKDRRENISMGPTPEWYRNEDATSDSDGWLCGILAMAGAGEEIFSGIDPDAYVRQLREGWD